MNAADEDLEKLIGLVDANRAGLERLRTELEELQRVLDSRCVRNGDLTQRRKGAEAQRQEPDATSDQRLAFR
jgi:hypothetical protein